MILLDYVGNKGLRLPREGTSSPGLWGDVRAAAQAVGAGAVFPPTTGSSLIDDHTPFLRAGVPAVDLIDWTYPGHAVTDTIDKLSPASLDAVGETVVQLLRERDAVDAGTPAPNPDAARAAATSVRRPHPQTLRMRISPTMIARPAPVPKVAACSRFSAPVRPAGGRRGPAPVCRGGPSRHVGRPSRARLLLPRGRAAAFPGLVLADGLGFSAVLGAFGTAIIFAVGVRGSRAAGDPATTASPRSSSPAAWRSG